ncbi:hypothetical protein AOLI_G00217590 [Acnodon oligacanthus]
MSVTLAAATARAKAEATQAAFAKKEIEIKLENARLEVTLHALEKEDAPSLPPKSSQPPSDHGGEKEEGQEETVVTNHTVCGEGFSGKSYSKICLVNVYPANDRSKRMFAMLDDQSNLSLARSEFFDMFKVDSFAAPYTLQTCAGVGLTAGHRAFGYVIESIDGATAIPLPMLIECNMIPNER